MTAIPNDPDGLFFPGYGVFKKRTEGYHGIRVVRVPLISRGKGSAIRLSLNYLSFALCASVLASILCRGKFDLIFVYEPSPITVGLPALVLKIIKVAPIMFWVQDLWPESLSATSAIRSKKVLGIVEKLVRFIYSMYDLVLVQSRAFFLILRSKVWTLAELPISQTARKNFINQWKWKRMLRSVKTFLLASA